MKSKSIVRKILGGLILFTLVCALLPAFPAAAEELYTAHRQPSGAEGEMQAAISSRSASGFTVLAANGEDERIAVYSWDFEDMNSELDYDAYSLAKPEGWTKVDADGDGMNWIPQNQNHSVDLSHHSGTASMTSASYENGTGILYPDNWLITPAVLIPKNAELSFWIIAQDADFPGDNVAVYIGESTDIQKMVKISDDFQAAADYRECKADLGEYAGKEMYIAFRHYKSTDLFRINLDDVSITVPAQTFSVAVSKDPADGGKVLYAGKEVESVDVGTGGTVKLTAEAADGFYFVNWTEDKKQIGTDPTLSITVTSPRSLVAHFRKTLVKVSKTDVATGEEVEGARIRIIEKDEEGNERIVEAWTSAKEAHTIEGLKTNEEYTLRETVAPDGYTVATDTKFTIDETGKVTSTGTITEDGVMLVEDAKTVVKISKTDIADGAELEGATIQILDSNGKVVDEWTSGTEAHTVEGLKTGVEYTLRETVAPDGYAIATDTTFTIDETGRVTSSGTVTEDGVMLVEDEKAFTITAKADPENAGTVTGAGTYKKDEKVTLKASAGVGYAFVNWTENGSEVSSAAEYTFNAEADRDLTANFRLLEYKVTWIDGDGNVLKTEQVKYGVTPVYTGDAPTKTADAQYSYTFNGNWSPEIVPVTEAAEYTAQFDKTVNKYTITWLNDDDSVIDTTEVEYGKTPTHADPTKAATAEYTYTFAGWDPAPSPVTGKATYKATFTAEKDAYTVTWVINGKEEKETYEYGATPTHVDPTRPATAQYTYTFKGWTPAVEKVTGDATYTAVFDAAVNHYTVTWVIDGLKQKEDYAYGEMPWHARPTKSGALGLMYVFRGWSPAVKPVTGNAVYTAVFEAQMNPLFPGLKNPTGVKTPGSDGEPTPPPSGSVPVPAGLPFIDVFPTDSFWDDVEFVYDHNIMNGISDKLFDPYGTLTRGMVVTILYRIEGSPDVEYNGTFTDVPDGEWFTDGVEWAASKGIVNGYGNGKFGPTDEVTREQLAAILYRYAGFKGYDVSIDENTNFLSYNDVFDIAEYAKLPMFWAIENDMILDTNGDLRPAEAALRWEVAAAIRAFCEKVAK